MKNWIGSGLWKEILIINVIDMITVQTTLQTEEKYPLPRGFSPSHIIGYCTCPRAFFIRYVLKIKPEYISPILELGSNVHEKLANQIFESDNPDEQKYLTVAKESFDKLPENPIFETTYLDKNNPGKYTGFCFRYPFVATFDIHWLDPARGLDWKTGTYKERKNWQYEIQAYLLNELFKQRYKKDLTEFKFIFLSDGFEYRAKSRSHNGWKLRTEARIENALQDIQARRFDKKQSFACDWCDVQSYCKSDCGFR